ncbi:hypothetical protein ACMD2_11610 [Ananas comosus]|uniref:Uncharacterized protein n=1 Tax=Ananas comosus TaxID=4615 RepID=A0A199WAL4_ANACO|nr:hypothetical protein ACMD2_11610 [Ananas comosus]
MKSLDYSCALGFIFIVLYQLILIPPPILLHNLVFLLLLLYEKILYMSCGILLHSYELPLTVPTTAIEYKYIKQPTCFRRNKCKFFKKFGFHSLSHGSIK